MDDYTDYSDIPLCKMSAERREEHCLDVMQQAAEDADKVARVKQDAVNLIADIRALHRSGRISLTDSKLDSEIEDLEDRIDYVLYEAYCQHVKAAREYEGYEGNFDIAPYPYTPETQELHRQQRLSIQQIMLEQKSKAFTPQSMFRAPSAERISRELSAKEAV